MNCDSRRTWLRQCAYLVGVGGLTLQRHRIAAAAEVPRVRVGIIGRSGRGDYGHAVDEAISKLDGVEVVAIADDGDKLQAAASRNGARQTYTDYRSMLQNERLDVVAICPRWIDQHHAMIVAAAEARCHVYMEKPFCRTLAECDDAIERLTKRNLKLAIAHISEYSPVFDAVCRLIADGQIGQLLELRTRGKEDRRGGGEDLWVLGSHILGLMRKLVGADPVRCSATVTAQGHPISKADVVEGAEGIGPLAGDTVQARYDFPEGVTGYFASHRNAGSDPSRFAIQIFGTRGIIELESGYMAPAHILRDPSWSPGRTGKSWERVTSAGIGLPEPVTDGSYQAGHQVALRDLFESIRTDRQPKCSAFDARSITEMIVSVFESQRQGRAVDLPLQGRVNPLALLE